jgi:LmbE family N-acetylglucosaminyl deacetylase
VVVTLDGSDGHRDHVRVRDVVTGLLAGTGTPVYLQCLPRSLMHAWVRHHAADEGKTAYVELPEIGTPDEELTTIVDTSALLDRRQAAIALHRSQQSPFDGLPDDVQRTWLGREHLVRVNPPWDGGPQETDLLGL